MDGLWRNFEVGNVFDTAYRSTSDVRSYDRPNGDALIISGRVDLISLHYKATRRISNTTRRASFAGADRRGKLHLGRVNCTIL